MLEITLPKILLYHIIYYNLLGVFYCTVKIARKIIFLSACQTDKNHNIVKEVATDAPLMLNHCSR